HGTLAALSGEAASSPSSSAPSTGSAGDGPAKQSHEPAVTVRKSLASREHILSLIDGKPYLTLKRHLGGHGLTPAQYRERYNLKPDYPMVAPAYAEKRRAIAKTIGLGRGMGAAATTKPQSKPDGGRKTAVKAKGGRSAG